MMSLPKFYFLEPEPLIKAVSSVKVKPVKLHLGFWKGLAIIAIGPRNGKIVGYRSDGKPIYAGSSAAEQLVQILQAKHTYTPAQQDVELVKWLQALGLKGAIDAEKVHLTKEGANLLQSAFGVAAQPLGGGKWGITKAQILPHLGEPLRPSEEQMVGWAAEMAAGEHEDIFPPLHTLKEAPAGKFSGSHGNQLFVDKSGKKWVFKPADPTISRAEEAASRIGRLLMKDRIPAAKYVKVKGKDGVLIQVLEGEVWQESSSEHSDPQLQYLKKYKDQVVQHEVVDWLISNHDSHAGNFLADGDKLVAIDKGQAWKWIGEDKLSPSFKGSNPSYQIYKKFWQSVQQGKIDSQGLVEAVAEMVNRAEKISPEQFSLLVAPYVGTWAGGKGADPHERLQKMTTRLQNLRADFEQFLSSQLGHPVTLPKPAPVDVNWETPPAAGEKVEQKQVEKPQPDQLKVPTAEILPKLQAVEQAPISAAKPAAGWPLTKKGPKTSATIVDPGKIPPAHWPAGTPAPGLHLQCDYKGKSYTLLVQENLLAPGKPEFKVLYPDGKQASFNSLNAAGDSLYLFNQGMPLDLNATEKKKKGISLGSKVFQLKQFEQELSEAYGKKGEPVPVAVATPEQLEEQKVIEPEQKEISVLGLLAHLPDGEVLTQGAAELPQEVKEFLSAYQGYDQLTTSWDLALTPGYAVKVTNPGWSTKNTMILTARLSKEGKPELWGWWEGLDGKLKQEVYSGTKAIFWEKALKVHENSALADLKAEYLKAAKLEEDQKKQAAQPVEPAGAPPEAVLPETAVVPPSAPKYTAGPLAPGTVVKVKKKVPGYDKKQEVTLSVLQNGKLLVEIPGQTAQTFDTLSAASDHVWVVQKGYADAADYKAKNKTNKVPSGGGWKFWGISPAAAPAAPGVEPGAGGVVAPVAPAPVLPAAGTPAEAPPVAPVVPEFDPLSALTGGQMSTPKSISKDDLEGYPVGTVIKTTYAGTPGKYIKLEPGDGNWKMVSPDWDKTIGINDAHANIALEEIEMVSMPQPPTKPKAAPAADVDYVTIDDFKELLADEGKFWQQPIGTKITTTLDGELTVFQKVNNNAWTMDGKGSISNPNVIPMINPLKVEEWTHPKKKTPQPAGGGTTLEFLQAAAIGTKIKTDDGNGNKTTYEKVFPDSWKVTLVNKFESADTAEFSTADAYGMMQDEKIESWEGPGAPVPQAPAVSILEPDAATKDQVDLVGKIKDQAKTHSPKAWDEIVKHLIALPEGIVLKTKANSGDEYQYTKQANQIWKVKAPGLAGTIDVPNGSLATDLSHEAEKIVAFTPAGQSAAPEKAEPGPDNWQWFVDHPDVGLEKLVQMNAVDFHAVPVGTKIGLNTGVLTKLDPYTWKFKFPSGAAQFDNANAKIKLSQASSMAEFVLPAPEKIQKVLPIPADLTEQHLKDYPNGTVVHAESPAGNEYTYKKDNGKWYLKGYSGWNEYSPKDVASDLHFETITSIEQGGAGAPEETVSAADLISAVESPEGLKLDQPLLIKKPLSDFPQTSGAFENLPEGTVVTTESSMGNTWIYTKTSPGLWEAKKAKSGDTFGGMNESSVYQDITTEKLLSFEVPPVSGPGPGPVSPVQKLDSIVDYIDLPKPVKDALHTVMTNVLALHKGDPAKLQKPAAWPDWVPPTALIFHGTIEGKEFYVFNSAMGQNNDGSVNSEIRFSVVLPDGTIHTGDPNAMPVIALGHAMQAAGITISGIDTKEALGLYGMVFPTGSTEADPFLGKAGTSGTLKPVEQMTPAEKTAKVKVNMPLKQALKVHPGLQEGKLKIKKAKGSGMYICLDGVAGASTKLYAALQDLGMTHVIKNTGGIPKINAQGAFVAVDSWVLDQEVTVETTALDASSEQHAPSDPNWQTMPEAKPKKKTKAQKEAEQKAKELQAKAEEIKAWGEQYPPVTGKEDLQVLALFQKSFPLYHIPVGVIARMDGDHVLLGHAKGVEELKKYFTDLAAGEKKEGGNLPWEMVSSPFGWVIRVKISDFKGPLEKLSGIKLGGIIKGPDGKEYPSGTTFKEKVVETTVEQLLPGEPGFHKIKEHKTEPQVLALIKISGNGEEQVKQMQAMIDKYGLEGPFPAPKVSDNSVIHSVFKKSLQKVWKSEKIYEPTIPPQVPDFVPGSLPFMGSAGLWEEVGDGSAELHSVAAIKPKMYGHVMRVGAPGQLRDFAIRFRKVKDYTGKLYYEFTGDLVEFDGLKTKLAKGQVLFASTEGKETKVGYSAATVMDYDPETGVHTETEKTLAQTASGFLGKTTSGSSIAVVPPSELQDTFKNTFRVRVPATLDAVEELREALKLMGKDPDQVLAPIDGDADRIYKKSMLVRSAMGARGWNESYFPPEKMHNESWLDSQISQMGIGDKLAGLRVVKTFDNQVTVVADDAEAFKAFAFPYVGTGNFGATLQLLQGSGWSSRRNRLLHGLWNIGKSKEDDFENGGAKATFFRVAGKDCKLTKQYTCQVIADPRVFQRLDWWRYDTDSFGCTSSLGGATGKHNLSSAPGRYNDKLTDEKHNEIMFEGGLSIADIVAVVVDSEHERDAMIKAVKSGGVNEINGRPIEEIIITAVHKGKDLYKCKPQTAASLVGIKKKGKGK